MTDDIEFPHRLNADQARALHRLMADGIDALNQAGNPANSAELLTIAATGPELEEGARTLAVMALEPDGTPEQPIRGWTIPPGGIAWPVDNDIQAGDG